MRRYLLQIKLGLLGLAALMPLIWFAGGLFEHPVFAAAAVLLNICAWGLFGLQVYRRRRVMRQLVEAAQGIGIGVGRSSETELLERVLHEVRRKNSSLIFSSLEGRITSKDELSRTLERTVALAYRLFQAESCELALFDRQSGQYHSSFVLGKPFRTDAQAMLSGAVEGADQHSPDVLIQSIAFAGTVLGSLRVALKSGARPSTADREIIKLLALQSSLALVNSQYNEELLKMKRASEESVRAKTGFLANLSHEIRAPLGIMLNAVELVLDNLCGEINADQRDTLKMVHGNGEHLLELINDVLDYAKVEAGKLQPQPVDIDVNELLRDVSEVVRTQAEAKSHKVLYTRTDEVLTISCDRRHIRQMLINLLTNAIKYTPDGGRIEVWAERSGGGKVKINVRDSGVGIEPAQRDKVFAAFERVDNSYSLSQVGTGLGMPLTRRLAEVNGGSVEFDSEPGKGSHFWLQFPSVTAALPVAAQQEGEIEIRAHGETLLLVEHSQGERDMMTRYLSNAGFRVLPAPDVVEALRLASTERLHLAILDNPAAEQEMGILKGLRGTAQTSNLPIILMTSRGFEFDIEKYLRLGVDRCLVRPVKLSELAKICCELLGGNAVRGGAARSTDADIKPEDTWN